MMATILVCVIAIFPLETESNKPVESIFLIQNTSITHKFREIS